MTKKKNSRLLLGITVFLLTMSLLTCAGLPAWSVVSGSLKWFFDIGGSFQ